MAKFCGQCGSPMKPGAKFCGQCGWQPIEPEADRPKAAVEPVVPPQTEHEVEAPAAKATPAPREEEKSPPRGPKEQTSLPRPSKKTPIPNRRPGPPASANAFKEFSRDFGKEPPQKKKGRGKGVLLGFLGVILLLVVVALISTFGFDFNAPSLPDVSLPSIGGGGIDAERVSGNWNTEFTTIKITLDGKTDPSFNVGIGRSTSANVQLALAENGEGSARISGASLGYDFDQGYPAKLEGDQLTIEMEEDESGTSLLYEATITEEKDHLALEGDYRVTYQDAYSGSVWEMQGIWTGTLSEVEVSESISREGVMSEITMEALNGTYSGTLMYTEITNMEALAADISEEEKDKIRQVIGEETTATAVIENGEFELTMLLLGSEETLDGLPPLMLEEGVLTMSMSEEMEGAMATFALEAVVKEHPAGPMIDGQFEFGLPTPSGEKVMMYVVFQLVKD